MHYARTTKLIKALPDDPKGNILWVVYNKDMVANAEKQIIEIKGQEYFDKYVKVTCSSGEISGLKCSAMIVDELYETNTYFDPMLHAMLGNGYD